MLMVINTHSFKYLSGFARSSSTLYVVQRTPIHACKRKSSRCPSANAQNAHVPNRGCDGILSSSSSRLSLPYFPDSFYHTGISPIRPFFPTILPSLFGPPPTPDLEAPLNDLEPVDAELPLALRPPPPPRLDTPPEKPPPPPLFDHFFPPENFLPPLPPYDDFAGRDWCEEEACWLLLKDCRRSWKACTSGLGRALK